MKIPLRWKQLFIAEVILLCICFFAVNLLVDFLDFSSHPAAKIPAPYYMHIFEGDDAVSAVKVKNYWPEISFFLLVIFGQIAIFRQRKLIFKSKQRTNG